MRHGTTKRRKLSSTEVSKAMSDDVLDLEPQAGCGAGSGPDDCHTAIINQRRSWVCYCDDESGTFDMQADFAYLKGKPCFREWIKEATAESVRRHYPVLGRM